MAKRKNESYSDNEISVDGYSIIRRDRPLRQGGGVVIYLKNGIPFIRKSEYERSEVEAIWLEIKMPYAKPFLLCALYRPPNEHIVWI